jgi:hypothetical protein
VQNVNKHTVAEKNLRLPYDVMAISNERLPLWMYKLLMEIYYKHPSKFRVKCCSSVNNYNHGDATNL